MTHSPLASAALPDGIRDYLSDRALEPVWNAARDRLERNNLDVRGTLTLTVDDMTADRLSGLLGHTVTSGRVRVRLGDLDQALRRSAARQGLVSVLGILGGRPLVDRAAARRAAEGDPAPPRRQADLLRAIDAWLAS